MEKTCRNCGQGFKTRQIIDGKIRNLYTRAFCLDCTGFGSGNNRAALGAVRIACSLCGREFEKDKSKGHVGDKCNSCWSREYKRERMQRARDYLGGCCEVCGYNKCSSALEFHHLDEKQKEFGISGRISRAWESIVRELKKCLLVCANCHREIHEGLIDAGEIVRQRGRSSMAER